MKREQHEAAIRTKILRVARKLFLTQGYQETTIRQIQTAAGVKTGTIYHFYDNKEAIFAEIVIEAFYRVLVRTQELSQANKLLHLATEIAWHIYTMIHNPASIALYLTAYNSPQVAGQLFRDQQQRSHDLFSERFPHLNTEDHAFFALAARGLMQSVTIHIMQQPVDDPGAIISRIVHTLLRMPGIPEKEIAATLLELQATEVETAVLETMARTRLI
ncbi:MAG: helix-turn-helix domain-containing protein [Saprospiraceae bacterium]